jgi:tRNA-dihydrouridine synthase B
MLNAPELAKRAEQAGVAMITVHGRTRCQFYTGRADWSAIRAVKDAIKIPLIANGDGDSVEDARAMLAASGADGVMLGRASYGRPWWPAVIAEGLEAGTGCKEPTLAEEQNYLRTQHEATLSLYGAVLGNRSFRKHLGWTVARLGQRNLLSTQQVSDLRCTLLTEKDNAIVATGIAKLFEHDLARAA